MVQKIKCRYLILGLILVFSFLPLFNLKAAGAALYFSPSSGSYQVGQGLTVNVYVSSDTQAINAISGVVSYSKDLLELASVSRDGSIISLWVQEPSYSQSSGIVNFEGIVLNPGFTGSAGRIIKLNFKVKNTGTASLTFNSGMVLANDGLGTNILSSLGQASFNISESQQETPSPPVKTPAPVDEIPTPAPTPTLSPNTPQVTSSTHPDQNTWYNINTATFKWQLPEHVTDVNILANKNPDSNPGVESDGLMDSYTYQNVEDGIWYFHIRFRTSSGWGPTTHFRFQVDTQTPEPFEIQLVDGQESFNVRPTTLFSTTDSLSGVDYYKIKIGDHKFENYPANEIKKNPYTLPAQKPGRHVMLVQAFDKAGNYSSASKEFKIKALLTPVITDIPQNIKIGETIVISGTTYDNAEVTISIQEGTLSEPQVHKVNTDAHGNFTFLMAGGLHEGVYQVWAEVTNQAGAISNPTEKYIIVIKESKLMEFGSDMVALLSVFVPLVSLIFLLGFVVWFGYQKFSTLKKRVHTQVGEAQYNLGQVFDTLRQDLKKDIQFLEKIKKTRKLTKEENELGNKLKANLDKIESVLMKEIRGIRRELK